ncbi:MULTISPECIES: hypothetical protein [unclassified Streptomyces]|uniref:hypothetical protein n=1 Tax=unclassified Streptomyces TaxID=2593676 RepID=UPI002DD87FDB|nr:MULTISPECIES: hypothetical protein [unclassified Streptomyces]WSA93662.1 hypothetical protein OIE63_20285 [Streptomyces sp. NBC_01795]WSB78034.1 hypothetical protein OHB04_21125 [Streptomyces sp. NBC_01775]WSS13714.1 hypothetical protein OG533_18855 [Streptomyces sp. NBC_01186]WSS42536.1 hypothetical protein OG220_19605 [Streptomyces sp. NBC_01187]
MRKFQRAAVAAVSLLAFSGVATQAAQAAPTAQAGYDYGKYGSWSACQSTGKGAEFIKKFHCVENGDGSWTLHIDEDQPCGPPTPNSTAAQASTKNGFSTMGC